jgi:nicotinate-nucleotide--dimethylbenzimidazole phosphoribosyltransferase
MPAQPIATPSATAFDEIRTLVTRNLPPLPPAPPVPQLGGLAPIWQWLASGQHKARPFLRRPRVALFVSAHEAYPERQAGLEGILAELKNGRHQISPLVSAADADLQVYELDLSLPSRDFRSGPALNEPDAARAISYGMMAVQPGVDLLLVSALNPVADVAAAEIAASLAEKTDPLESLLRFGGFDIAAMIGAIVAARLARVPVIVEGAAADVATDILRSLHPDAARHTRKASALLKETTLLPPPCHGAMLVPFLKSLVLAA